MKADISQRVTLSCNVSDSKTEVKWYKDGKLLISSRTIYSETKGNSRQLVIEKVEKSDAGEYSCEVGGEKLVFRILVSGTRVFFLHSVISASPSKTHRTMKWNKKKKHFF